MIKLRQELAGINNLVYSLGETLIGHVEAEAVCIYYHDRGFFDPRVEFLRKSFDLLNINYQFYNVDKDSIAYGELPLLRIENMFFRSQHFVDVILKLIFDEAETPEDLANRQIASLCKEMSQVTSFFMWVNREIVYRYRHRKWLLFSPIERAAEYLNGWKKAFASEELGYHDNNHAIESGKLLLTRLETIYRKNQGFFIGPKEKNIKANILELLVYCTLQEIIRNTVKSDLYDIFVEKYVELKKFCEEFETRLTDLLTKRESVQPLKIRIKKQEFEHKYKSNYKTVDVREKEFHNSIFLGISTISLLLYVFIYYKG